jgi:hypothetical protein
MGGRRSAAAIAAILTPSARSVVRRTYRALATSVARASHEFFIDAGGDHRSSVFLSGSGRGGTTWIAQILNADNEYRMMFEPFCPAEVPLCRTFGSSLYLRPDAMDAPRRTIAGQVLAGRMKSGWVDQYNHRWWATTRLIKDIRTNLYLRWLNVNFPGMPIIQVLRHPLATVASRMSLGWNTYIDSYLAQPALVEDHLASVAEEMRAATDPFEQQVFRWCVEAYVPLRQFAPGEIHLAFYERFVTHPYASIAGIFRHIGRIFDERAFSALRAPSTQTRRKKSAIAVGGDIIGQWREVFSGERVRRALHILSLFGLDRIYSDAIMPDVGAAHAMLGAKN